MSDAHSHDHGSDAAANLDRATRHILIQGLAHLVPMTEGLFRPLKSEKHPYPLTHVAHASLPDPLTLRVEIADMMSSDIVATLPGALALLELLESNEPDTADFILEDMPFIRACFNSKRRSGWIAFMGDADREAIAAALDERWQFEFFSGPPRPTGIYVLLNMLARYAYVYGRVAYGDTHAMGHFVEDHCPGLIICHGELDSLELTLSLIAMKMGVPAIVPTDYPFPLGRTVRTDSIPEIVEAVAAFPNIRCLLQTPDVPQLPAYCDPAYRDEEVEPGEVWGDTPHSFYLLRKGSVDEPGVVVRGQPGPAMGVLVTVQGEPLDAFDCGYIERQIVGDLANMHGVAPSYDDGRLVVSQAPGTELDPRRVGEVLLASLRRNFPRLTTARAEIIFDEAELEHTAPTIRAERESRQSAVREATEESESGWCACVACSPFAPDHVCILTPERRPQCGRPYEMIKTGALYGYDDTSNIHHSKLHRDLNSFRAIDRGECLDELSGEWTGTNAAAADLTHGRTPRVLLHSVDDAPHTGCGCFRLIMFRTDLPRPGIGVMDAGFDGVAPGGRRWADLHYALAGKQTPGMAGASPSYLSSRKFLQAHGGWESVVWVSPKIAEIMGDRLPEGIAIG